MSSEWSFREPVKLAKVRLEPSNDYIRAGIHIRDKHKQLLICIAHKFGLGFHALGPCLLYDLRPRIGLALIQSSNFIEIDLFVDKGLKGGCDFVRMIMTMAIAIVVVTVVTMSVRVIVGHIFGFEAPKRLGYPKSVSRKTRVCCDGITS